MFNIGNIGGTALGTNAMFGLDVKIGGAISALIAIAIFLSKRAGIAMDRIVVVLGVVMIAMVLYAAVVSGPPVGEALRQTVLPDDVDFLIITTLIGGTVGGYITYAGAHRLVDSGITGPEHVRDITRGSVTGILVTGVMRTLLFLAVLGVVAGGVTLAADNPPASAFQAALGDVGVRVFGIILWAASITSVIGASYTSVSFLAGFSRRLEERRNLVTVGFIVFSGAIYLALGKAPVTLLVLAGALNGLILPVGFAHHPVGGRAPDRPAPRLPLPEVAARDRRARVGAHGLPRLELPRRHRGPAVTGPRIDLNADLGESFGSWTLGDDDALLELITSANVACGFHAGDPTVLRRTCARAAERGVVIGAQVGYRDLAGFGRRFIDVEPHDLTNDVLYQLGALEAFARVAGTRGPLRQAARGALQRDRPPRGAGRGGRRGRTPLRPDPAGPGPARIRVARGGRGGRPDPRARGLRRPRLHARRHPGVAARAGRGAARPRPGGRAHGPDRHPRRGGRR